MGYTAGMLGGAMGGGAMGGWCHIDGDIGEQRWRAQVMGNFITGT